MSYKKYLQEKTFGKMVDITKDIMETIVFAERVIFPDDFNKLIPYFIENGKNENEAKYMVITMISFYKNHSLTELYSEYLQSEDYTNAIIYLINTSVTN